MKKSKRKTPKKIPYLKDSRKDPIGRSKWEILSFRRPKSERFFPLKDQETSVGDPFGRLRLGDYEREILPLEDCKREIFI